MADPTYLAELYLQRHPREAATLLEGLETSDVAELIATLDDDKATDLLLALSPTVAAAALHLMADDHLADYLGGMPRQEAANILRRLPRERRATVLQAMPAAARLQLEVILHQPAHRIGAWMDSHPFTLAPDTTVEAARRRLRGIDDPVSHIFLTDDDQKLLTIVPVSRLFAVRGSEPISMVAEPPQGMLRASTTIENALDNPAWRDVDCLPVVDRDGVLVGSIRHASLREAIAQQRKSETDNRSNDYMSVANNLYVGLAEVLVASIARPKAAHPQKHGEGETR